MVYKSKKAERLLRGVIVVIFKNIFYLKIYYNNIFLFLKIYF